MNSGRTQEISRLIGRALRAAVDLKGLNEKQILVDCDVLQADGGTRTAAITGGFVALYIALEKLRLSGLISSNPCKHYISAISVGLKDGEALLDLCYEEDVEIGTDMNFVMTDDGKFIEIQGTAEHGSFDQAELMKMLGFASQGCKDLIEAQKSALKSFLQR